MTVILSKRAYDMSTRQQQVRYYRVTEKRFCLKEVFQKGY